jgi:hypothetical protein
MVRILDLAHKLRDTLLLRQAFINKNVAYVNQARVCNVSKHGIPSKKPSYPGD